MPVAATIAAATTTTAPLDVQWHPCSARNSVSIAIANRVDV
jgi:hypothetical protein